MKRRISIAVSLLVGALAVACTDGTGPRAIHVTGEYGRFDTAYLLRDCATDQEYSLTMPPDIFADLLRQTLAAGAQPEETLLITVDATATAEQRYLYRVSRISHVRRGDCDRLRAQAARP